MRLLKIRCRETGAHFFHVRRPNKEKKIVNIIPLVICPICHPDQSNDVCGGCRLPFSVVGKHSKGLCLSCFWANWRYNKKSMKTEPEADSNFTST